MSEAAGTVWNGTGNPDRCDRFVARAGRLVGCGAAFVHETISITLRPAGGAAPRGTIDFATSTAALHDVVVELPATVLASALPAKGAIVLGGNLAFTASAFDWNGERGRRCTECPVA
jgi:hypothetical protein